MVRARVFLLSAAAFILPALAQIGNNCDIVRNYTVVSQDTLGGIATANGVTVAQLAYVNAIPNVNFIDVGQIIQIPNPACEAPPLPITPEVTATCSTSSPPFYTVVPNDTLTIIAETKLGITLASLVAANSQIVNIDSIAVGDVINVPLCKDSSPPANPGYKLDTPPTTRKRNAKNRVVV